MTKQDAINVRNDQRRDALTEHDKEELDATHESSVRGEHRYPDRHQTDAEQKARHDRDALKRKLEGEG